MADSKITALDNLTSADPANDMIPIVDVSATPPASGNTKRISINNLLACSPSATLASATISGDLTVRTNKLAVTSTGVGAGTASPLSVFTVQSQASARLSVRTTDAVFGTITGGTAFDSLNGSDASLVPFGVRGSTVTLGSSAGIGFQIDASGNATWQNVGGVAGTAMTLNATGLGIGTTAAQKLTVLTNIGVSASTAAAADDRLIFTENMASANLGSQIVWKAPSGNAYASIGITNGAAGNNGTLIFSTSSSIFGSNNVERMRIDNAGNPIFQPSATPATLGTNGQLTVNATSNTNLRFSYRGSDGTTRVANITLA